jgi:xanthine/CO dehydrogenase XdhC/CoxF family maturation factor
MFSSYEILDAVTAIAKPCTLATIIRVEGSSYRKEGAMMLFEESGAKLGMLSAGCIEEELFHYTKAVTSEKWSIHTFDIRGEDDLSWGVGCNGILHILLEQVNEAYSAHLQRVKTHTEKGFNVWMIKNLTLSKTLFFSENGDRFGDWEEELFQPYELKNGLYDHLYVQCFSPRPRLFVFGAGEDAKPLVRLAKEVGFSVTICDWREGLCTQLLFPEADACVVGFPKELMSKIAIAKHDFVVIMTHHFQRDQELVALLLRNPCRYLGILGSRHRTARLFAGQTKPHWIFSPAGLSIGAQGPNEIAISIMAEIIQIVRVENNENSRPISGCGKQQANGESK